MPDRVRDLNDFVREVSSLLRVVDQCSAVLFRSDFRGNLHKSTQEVVVRLEGSKRFNELGAPDKFEAMIGAGLAGAQLELKLESFEAALVAFEQEGKVERLENALDAGGTILGSLAGAIPGFGSFAQELVDFLLKELKRRFWRGGRAG